MKEFFEPIVIIIFLILFSILGRVILEKIGQKWITTFAHTTTLILLPVITFMITKVISGNIALSLGMVGALSIVRFRNPVKSPLELVLFFALITIGIGCAVNFKLSIILTLMINMFIFGFFKIDNNLKKRNKSLFSLSFEEGLNFNTLEVESSKEILELEQNDNLKQFFISNNPKNFNYKVESKNKNEIENLNKVIKDNPNILNISIHYAR